jgi:hypothetical protein
MGPSMRDEVVASLCEAAADLIATHPEAAAQVFRSLGGVLRQDIERRRENDAQDAESMRRRGYATSGGII